MVTRSVAQHSREMVSTSGAGVYRMLWPVLLIVLWMQGRGCEGAFCVIDKVRIMCVEQRYIQNISISISICKVFQIDHADADGDLLCVL
jgi:hypothetical protein